MRLKSRILSLTLVGAIAMPLLYAAPAHAKASRTSVSGTGDDAVQPYGSMQDIRRCDHEDAAGRRIDVINGNAYGRDGLGAAALSGIGLAAFCSFSAMAM